MSRMYGHTHYTIPASAILVHHVNIRVDEEGVLLFDLMMRREHFSFVVELFEEVNIFHVGHFYSCKLSLFSFKCLREILTPLIKFFFF
jgi:hypothetical protein